MSESPPLKTMIATITQDPAAWIFGAALLSGAIGFMGCALFASRTITEAKRQAYQDGYAAANREIHKPKL